MASHSGTTTSGMEWSIHRCPNSIRREVASVLPGADMDKLLIVPTCQQSSIELVRFGEEADQQKDLLLERMVHKECQVVYPEVEGMSCLLGYKTSNAGCCKVLLHPKWGSAVYPATLFTTAPEDELLAAIQAAGAETQ